jgi:hypothetical protein
MRRGEEYLADAIFLRALGGIQPAHHRLNFLFADIDEGFDLAAQQPPPRQLAFDLPLHRRIGRSLRAQIIGEVLGVAFEVTGHTREGLLDLVSRDLDLVGLGFLDLKGFVDQVAQHLEAKPFALFTLDFAVVCGKNQRQPLIDVGLRDDRAVDDRGRLANQRIGLAKYGELLRKIEPSRGWIANIVDRLRCRGNRDQRTRHHQAALHQVAEILARTDHARPIRYSHCPLRPNARTAECTLSGPNSSAPAATGNYCPDGRPRSGHSRAARSAPPRCSRRRRAAPRDAAPAHSRPPLRGCPPSGR